MRNSAGAAAFAFLFLIYGCARENAARPSASDIEGARATALSLGTSLKARLVEAINTGGPIAAVDVCSLEAPLISQSASISSRYEVSRTALRVRNPQDAPDAWERRRLVEFLNAADEGGNLAALEFSEVVEEDGAATFRWMKPIVTEAACVICHGEAIAPELQAKIGELYPDDKATGFREGEIRGAFSVSKRLDQ